MNKKGFTLIELLAVVTIIALLSLIAIPNITKNIREKKTEIDEANQKLLASAADVYIENNKNYDNSYEANGSTYCITIQTLIDNNYLETPFKDINGSEIDYTKQVQATFQAEYNSFNYEIVDNCQELKQYVSRPNLTENMIPVIYDDEQNTWKKADKNSHWYNYQEKKWANAVLVKELKETDSSKSRDEYISAPAGTPILEQDILAYFTWIPRFRYQLFESNTETPINIVFENISTTKSTGTEKNQWLTHPAFTYNNQELSGIWVGKYETSIDNNILIKNNTPITNIDYVEANKKIIEMTNDNNVYGLKNVNTHMTRNSEWGALTYLTNSIYGNNQNNSSTGNQTGIYNISGNKEFVILDNESENSLGYALSETNNWTTDNSYPTTENLYLTRGNNSIYNYQNSSVKDENTTFRITLTNIESQNQNYQRKYIVTFDPNGGTLSETSKEVSYHEPYGNLPTPTREGYTFLGWHGKNIIDKSQSLKEGIQNETPLSLWATTAFNNNWVINNLNPSTQYTISYDVEGISVPEYDSKYSGNLGFYLYSQASQPGIYLMSGDGYYISVGEKYHYERTFTAPTSVNLPESKYVLYTYSNRYLKDGTGVYSTIRLYNLQLEEGDTATEYEPYYITPTTPVVQDKNHTLKAIWKANE